MRRYYYFKSIHFQRLLSQGVKGALKWSDRASEQFIMDAGEASSVAATKTKSAAAQASHLVNPNLVPILGKHSASAQYART